MSRFLKNGLDPMQLAALLGVGFMFPAQRQRALSSLPPKRSRRIRVYRVNSGVQATERYRLRIEAGLIPESQILRAAK